MRKILAFAIAGVVLHAVPSTALEFTDQAPKYFAKYCTGCHDKSSADVMKDSAWWDQTIEKMDMKYYAHNNAHLAVAEKTEIARYLEARGLFISYCGKCHDTDKSLQKVKDAAGWKETVKRMSGLYEAKFGNPIPVPYKERIEHFLTIEPREFK